MHPQDTFVQHNNKYYILANSSYVDDITRTLNFGDTFAIFDRWGDANPIGRDLQGVYHRGTRYLSEFKLSMNGARPFLLSSTIRNKNELISVDLTNPTLSLNTGNDISHGNIHINRNMYLQEGVFYGKIECTNHSLVYTEFSIQLEFNADFKDIFEIRGTSRKNKGVKKEPYLSGEDILTFEYTGLDRIARSTHVKLNPVPHEVNNRSVVYQVALSPGKSFILEVSVCMDEGDDVKSVLSYDEAFKNLDHHLATFKDAIGHIASSNENFNEWINRSNNDLMSLLAQTAFGVYPYAGVPWFNTPFGRDGIITALFTLWIAPFIAKGVLKYLAHHQAQLFDSFSDAEPGKILHESRYGEMANCREIPFKHYYGSVDSTPLFVILAGRYLKRTADLDLIIALHPHLELAMQWIDTYGDIDGDGFYEYQRKEKSGLYNQGWKDSGDSISHADGTLAELPIALCEVQAYVVEANRQMAYISHKLGNIELADRYRDKADHLQNEFNERFWNEKLQSFILALDDLKKPCVIKASNVGHALYCEAVKPEYARSIVDTLLSEEMYTGWGIRTLGSKEARYNPMSYHNGSVWPFDTAIAAAGMAKYGYTDEALKVLEGMFETAQLMDLNRLPELFCGFEKRKGEGPTAYPVACSPQAWSVSSIYAMIQAILSVEIDAFERQIHFNYPKLPSYMEELLLAHIPLGTETITIKVKRFKSTIGLDLIDKPGGWKVVTVK